MQFILEQKTPCNILTAYRGTFSQGIIKSLLVLIEKKLQTEIKDITMQKKVFNIALVFLQNVCKNFNSEFHPPVFILSGTLSEFFISAGIIIENIISDGLKNKLLAINTMEIEDIKELHKSLITSKELSVADEMGLGLVELFLKSGNKIKYHFDKMSDKQSYVVLQCTVLKNTLQP